MRTGKVRCMRALTSAKDRDSQLLDAQVAELVDALVSGASALFGRGSSSLLLGTTTARGS